MSVLTRNNVSVVGSGSVPMLFAHGFGCNQQMWRHIVPAFEQDFRIILFDYVGCGDSDHDAYDPVRYAELDGYAQDVIEICEALNLDGVIFVGHSVSSIIGMIAAQQAPALFRTMVMLGPSACYVNEPGYNGGFDRSELEQLVSGIGSNQSWPGMLAPVVAGNPDRPQFAIELENAFCSLEPKAAHQFAKATFLADYRPLLPAHQVSTLLLQNADDQIAPVSAGEYIANYVRNGTLVVLPASGHIPHLSAPEKTVAAMWDHLYEWRSKSDIPN